MNPTDVLEGFGVLLDADVEQFDRDDIAAIVALSARLRGWHDSFDMRCAQRTTTLRDAGQAESPESMFGRAGNRSSKESEAVNRRADIGARLPLFQAGLEHGAVSAGHLDAMAAVRSRLDDDTCTKFDAHESELLDAAASQSVDAFARSCRERARRLTPPTSDAEELDHQRAKSNVKHWVDKITGMVHTHLELDPIRDAMLWSSVNNALASLRQQDGNARTPWQQLQVNAFIAAVQGGVIADSSSTAGPQPLHAESPEAALLRRIEQRVPEIGVLVDYQTIISGLHDHSICETEDGTPIPVSTARRLCCDAEIIPIVLGGTGEVLDVGRGARTVNRAQRRALRAIHRTCAHPDCTVAFSACKIHHIRWWARDRGPTDIDNLLPLCEKHHHVVHEGRWTLTMTPHRVATWTRPDGTIHHTGNTTDRQPATSRATPPPRSCQHAPDNRPADRPMRT